MTDLTGLLDLIPVGDIAKKLGIDESVAESAVKQVLPTIVAGLATNAQNPDGAQSLEKALSSHSAKVPQGKAKIADIDTADGEKIVNHVFGENKKAVVVAVADTTEKADPGIIAKILPIVAPIVLSWVASQFFGKKEEAAPAANPATPASGGGIGELLGGLLGGQQGQDIIGGVLGGLLGGKK